MEEDVRNVAVRSVAAVGMLARLNPCLPTRRGHPRLVFLHSTSFLRGREHSQGDWNQSPSGFLQVREQEAGTPPPDLHQ